MMAAAAAAAAAAKSGARPTAVAVASMMRRTTLSTAAVPAAAAHRPPPYRICAGRRTLSSSLATRRPPPPPPPPPSQLRQQQQQQQQQRQLCLSSYSHTHLRPWHQRTQRQTQQQTQVRRASILASLADNRKAYGRRVRVGRGASSGHGKTSGRGHKGQGQHGKVPAGFEGGQTPLRVVKGLRGFENVHALDLSPVNLDRIQSWVDQGRLDASRTITVKELVESRCIHGVKDGVKLLARGASELRTPISVLVSRASAAAIAAVEGAGGSVVTRYYTAASIQRILRGQTPADVFVPGALFPRANAASTAAAAAEESDEHHHQQQDSQQQQEQRRQQPLFKYRLPDPSSRKDMEYYRDPAHRGYLAYTVPEGESPSLFFKTPKQPARRSARRGGGKGAGKMAVADNRLW